VLTDAADIPKDMKMNAGYCAPRSRVFRRIR
jgi:hypothetical protein